MFYAQPTSVVIRGRIKKYISKIKQIKIKITLILIGQHTKHASVVRVN